MRLVHNNEIAAIGPIDETKVVRGQRNADGTWIPGPRHGWLGPVVVKKQAGPHTGIPGQRALSDAAKEVNKLHDARMALTNKSPFDYDGTFSQSPDGAWPSVLEQIMEAVPGITKSRAKQYALSIMVAAEAEAAQHGRSIVKVTRIIDDRSVRIVAQPRIAPARDVMGPGRFVNDNNRARPIAAPSLHERVARHLIDAAKLYGHPAPSMRQIDEQLDRIADGIRAARTQGRIVRAVRFEIYGNVVDFEVSDSDVPPATGVNSPQLAASTIGGGMTSAQLTPYTQLSYERGRRF